MHEKRNCSLETGDIVVTGDLFEGCVLSVGKGKCAESFVWVGREGEILVYASYVCNKDRC